MPARPLNLSYFVCDACAHNTVVVSFCMSCSNIACIHMFFGLECFQCAPVDIDWPCWNLRFPLKACGDHD